MQADGIGAGVQNIVAEHLVEAVQGAAQAGAAFAPITFGPQEGRQRIAAVRLATHCEVYQQRQGFAQVQLDWRFIALQPRLAQDK